MSQAGVAVHAWKPPIPGIREVFHARLGEHAYPLHTHDAWTLFIVDEGAIRYDLDRHARGAELPMVSILPPYVAHDGRSATNRGYRKRVLYLETSLLGEQLIGPAVDRPSNADPWLRRQVVALHDALASIDDTLEAETRLAFITERLCTFLGQHAAEPPAAPAGDLAEQLRAYLDAHLFERATIGAAARQLGANPTHLARAFSTTFGIPPHAYVIGRRLDAARDRILRGQALADVAAEVGFVDQPHLTRRFKLHQGVTPGRFVRSEALAPLRQGSTGRASTN